LCRNEAAKETENEGAALRADGFTIIELLVVIAIIPMVVAAIAVGLLTVLQNNNQVSNSISQSGDAEVVSSEFVADVQSASMLTTSGLASSPTICASAAQLGITGVHHVLSLQWADGTTEITYLEVPNGFNYGSVFRNFCQNGTQTPVSTTLITRDAQLALAPIVAGSSCPSTLGQGSTCPVDLGWTQAVGTAYVQLALNEPVPKSTATYTYTLVASPRASSPTSSGIPGGGNLPLLLLGGSGADYSCSGSPNTLTVDGQMAMDSTSGGASAGGTVTADGGYYTADTSNPSGALGGGGTYNPTGSMPTAGPPIPDPYQNLTPPSVPAPSPTNGTSGTSYQPGLYSSAISISGSGNYTFAPGTYYLESGFKVSGSATVTGTGVFFYITGGTVNIGGSGQVQLTAPSTGTPASGLLIWSTTSDVTLSGSGSGNLFGGTIYAPNNAVIINGGGSGSGLQAGAVLSKTMSCVGNTHVQITGAL
jgi:prepilin-type N-terminal cleavage/methylation domain-containing protein